MSYQYWIYIATGLFGIGIALGLLIPVATADLFGEELTVLEELAAVLGPFQITTAAFIFVKNVSALLVSFVFSPFLCLPPALALSVNGWLLSFVSVAVVQEESIGLLLAGILPHGIIEIPALIIGEAAANISSECRKRHPQIPWVDIIGMRNRLIHAYFDVDLDILWNTATTKLEPLIKELNKIILRSK